MSKFITIEQLQHGDLFRVCNEQSCFFNKEYSSTGQIDLIMSMDDHSCVVAIYIGKVTLDQYQYTKVFVKSGIYILDSYYSNFTCEVVAHV